MQATIRNIVPEFLALWADAADQAPAEQRALWQARYAQKHQAIFDLYYTHWGSPDRLGSALKRFPAIVERIRTLDPEGSVSRSISGCAALFDAPAFAMPCVFLVGTFTSNGWVTPFEGQPTTFVALECFRTQGHLDLLISHETAHSFHARLCPQSVTCESVGGNLFKEGLVTLATTHLHPGLSEVEYLWFDSEPQAWLAKWEEECQSRWPELRARLLDEIDQSDPGANRRWFQGGGAEEGLPVRAGYYAGLAAVRWLHGTYSFEQMARWEMNQANAAVAGALQQMAGPAERGRREN